MGLAVAVGVAVGLGAGVELGVADGLVHQVSDWCSGAAAYFGWMREAKRENTRFGL